MVKKLPKLTLHENDARPILGFADEAAFDAWLKQNCDGSEGIWIKFAKKGSGVLSVNYQQALDVALCYGWIDSLVHSLDKQFYLQRFTPRGRRSKWSKINCGKVEELIRTGRMTARGMKEIEAAKSDGRWENAYGGQRTIEVPPDLKQALARNRKAAKFFATLTGSNRYAILFRIHDAKKPETRQRRIEQFVRMLADGETIH